MRKYINKQTIIAFLLGAILFSIVPVSATIEEYICYKADYKLLINGVEYKNEDLPILNYKGNTYGPLRSMLEAAGFTVNWNAELKQAEAKLESKKESEVVPMEKANLTPDGIAFVIKDDGIKYVRLMDIGRRYQDRKINFKISTANENQSPDIYDMYEGDKIIFQGIECDKFSITYDYYVEILMPILQQ